MSLLTSIRGIAVGAALALSAVAVPAQAEDVVVTHFGDGMYGVPYSVALAKGWFKEAGLDVTGFLTSKGGGTSVRNLMAGDTLYAEVALPAALAAIKEGYNIKIINSGTVGRNGFWITREDVKIETPADLKGKRIAFTRPKSSSEAQALAYLKLHKVAVSDVKMVAAGDIAGGITALVNNQADLALATEPAYSLALRNGQKLKAVLWLDKDLPPPTQTVGVATTDAIAKSGDKLKKLLEVRQRAVRFIYSNPEEAAELSAKDMRIDKELMLSMIKSVRNVSERWWSEGELSIPALDTAAAEMAAFGQITLPIDWKATTDSKFLPAALQN